MAKRMLIDSTHVEETRVAVVDNNRLIEFDYESNVRVQLKGNIFLAKVTRVEPSLQAAFVNFGGNRHGFLPFSEIHPDYFRIPVADREALVAAQQAEYEAAIAAEEAAIAAEEAEYEAEQARQNGSHRGGSSQEEDLSDFDETGDNVDVQEGGAQDTDPQYADSQDNDAQNQAQDESQDGEKTRKSRHPRNRRRGSKALAQSASVIYDDAPTYNDGPTGASEDVAVQARDQARDQDIAQDIIPASDQDDLGDDHEDLDTDAEMESANSPDSLDSLEGSDAEGTEADGGDGELTALPQHRFIYRGVTEINPETFEILATDEKDSLSFDRDLAVKIEEIAKAREDVVRVRLHYRHSENGVKKRSVWVAFHADNAEVDHEQATAQEEAARERRRERGGHFRRGRGGRFRTRGGNRRMQQNNRQVDLVGGEGVDSDHSYRPTLHRNYKIQEVIKRGQIMLIQVQKEERGNKGAAVTTYLSLPGRFCVLMPNSARGGGVSRKIASFAERKRMRHILRELGTPQGMSVILRTAGVERDHEEIKRDLDYLMRLWDSIRDLTLKSSAPAMIYEEGDLVKRAVRDIYSNEIEEILISGNEGHKQAKDFMKLLMPDSVKKIKHYKEDKIPLFHRYQVENQIAEMGEPVVTLKSGGYLVINPTEALVSIDVNSGRATKERHIEETALKTNLEAADEVARQLRLRDLGGLVVIDFIDMEEHRNNAKVERRLREALSTDRARIQVGRISSFGLLELSRQRLNPSLTEAQFEKCPHCKGVGNIRTVDSATIMALRALEEEGIHGRATQIFLSVPNAIALYILNQKRDMLATIEKRYGFTVFVRVDETLAPTGHQIESFKAAPTDDDVNDDEDHDDQDVSDSSRDSGEDSEGKSEARQNHRRDHNREGRGEGRRDGHREGRGEGHREGRGRERGDYHGNRDARPGNEVNEANDGRNGHSRSTKRFGRASSEEFEERIAAGESGEVEISHTEIEENDMTTIEGEDTAAGDKKPRRNGRVRRSKYGPPVREGGEERETARRPRFENIENAGTDDGHAEELQTAREEVLPSQNQSQNPAPANNFKAKRFGAKRPTAESVAESGPGVAQSPQSSSSQVSQVTDPIPQGSSPATAEKSGSASAVKAAAASNDTGPHHTGAAAQASPPKSADQQLLEQVLDDTTPLKKKGWWNRLMEK